MATNVLDLSYTLNETEANRILATPRKIIKESNIFNDRSLMRSERIKLAADILKSRK